MIRKDTENFIISSKYDLQTADAMFKSGRYLYVIFMCHLSIEKMLKAVFAEEKYEIPPRTHNLIFLIKNANITFPQHLFDFVAKINNVSVVTRYPEDFSKLIKVYPKKIAYEYFVETKDVIIWLRKDKRLKK